MNSTQTKLKYLLRSAAHYLTGRRMVCPECHSRGDILERKAFVTQLRRCQTCQLLFRTPTINEQEMCQFYESDYAQNTITQLPSDSELSNLKEAAFAGTSLDYRPYIDAIRRLGYDEHATVYDYGCSWGYGVWQFSHAGFKSSGWEIDRKRLSFGVKKLDVIEKGLNDLPDKSVDVFFSSHVIEHVPYPRQLIRQALSKVRPGGMLFCATPNGSTVFRAQAPTIYHKLLGLEPSTTNRRAIPDGAR